MIRDNDRELLDGDNTSFDPAVVQRTDDALRKELENLQRRLNDVKLMKKSVTKDYNDQIKEIENDIAGILAQLA